MISVTELRNLISAGEGSRVEFKQSVPSKVKELSEEVCAFANATGGYLIIGVQDDNKVIGADINNSKRAAVQDSISEISPSVQYSMYCLSVDYKNVWVIEVKTGNAKPYIFSGNIFVREGSLCRKLTRAEDIRDFFQASDKVYFDATPMQNVDLSALLDKHSFQEFRNLVGFTNDIPDAQILENLQSYTDNGEVKRGAVLMFAKQPEEFFPHAVVRCVRFKGLNKVYIIDDKTFGGTLLTQYNEAINWIKNRLQISYSIKDAGPRQEIWEIPLSAFREALLNAMLHRDYYEQGACVTVEMYDDRIEIANPGGLLPLVAKNFGKRSLTRNPFLFNMFTRMHLVEHIGSGIPRMVKDMVDAGLPKPEFETEGMFVVTLFRPVAKYIKEQIEKEKLTERQKSVIEILKKNPNITMEEAGNLLNLGRTTVYQTLKELKQKGYVSFAGRKSCGEWLVSEPETEYGIY